MSTVGSNDHAEASEYDDTVPVVLSVMALLTLVSAFQTKDQSGFGTLTSQMHDTIPVGYGILRQS